MRGMKALFFLLNTAVPVLVTMTCYAAMMVAVSTAVRFVSILMFIHGLMLRNRKHFHFTMKHLQMGSNNLSVIGY